MFRQTSDLWIRPFPRDKEAIRHSDQICLRLFCFPHAGGGASVFRSWVQYLPPTVDICPIQLPGRESRLEEKPFIRLAPLVSTLARVLRPSLEIPFVFFGHSFGALLAYELTRELRWQYRLTPSCLFVAAFPAPQMPTPNLAIHKLPQPEFIDGLRRFNAIPDEILHNPDLLELFLPILRADFAVYETYKYEPEPPLTCPISVFGGLNDRTIDRDALVAWREQTVASFHLRMYPGHHFFIRENHEKVLQAIVGDLELLLDQELIELKNE